MTIYITDKNTLAHVKNKLTSNKHYPFTLLSCLKQIDNVSLHQDRLITKKHNHETCFFYHIFCLFLSPSISTYITLFEVLLPLVFLQKCTLQAIYKCDCLFHFARISVFQLILVAYLSKS